MVYKKINKGKISIIFFTTFSVMVFLYAVYVSPITDSEQNESIKIAELTPREIAAETCKAECTNLEEFYPNWNGKDSLSSSGYCTFEFEGETCYPSNQLFPDLPVFEESLFPCTLNGFSVMNTHCS